MQKKVHKPIPPHILARGGDWIDLASAEIQRDAASEVVGTVAYCPICQSRQVREMVVVYGHGYLECRACRHLFCASVFSATSLERLYGGEREGRGPYKPSDEAFLARVENVAKPKVEFISSFSDSSCGLWLDLGCGAGDVLWAAKEMGWDVRGVEPGQTGSDFCRSRSLPVIRDFLDSEKAMDFAESAAVISLLDVIEHLGDPEKTLASLSRRMSVGTVLAVAVPRTPSLSLFSIKTFPEKTARHIMPPQHLHLFSEKSLRMILERNAFRMDGIWCYGQDFLEILSSMARHGGFAPFLWPELNDGANAIQRAVDESGLSDSMLVVATRQ